MITPFGLNLTIPTTQPISQLQHATEQRGALNSELAHNQVDKEVKTSQETVINKEDAAFYEQNHDAKDESKNKYANLYSNKKNKDKGSKDKPINSNEDNTRKNFDIKI